MKFKEKFACLSDRKVSSFVYLQVFFNGMITILNIFVNTFLLKAYGTSSNEAMIYNIILATVQPIAMCTSFWISRRGGYLLTQRIGFGFYAVALILMCIFGEDIAFMYPLLAALISFGAGYYYAIYSVQMLHYTHDGNRDAISGVLTVLGTIISLVLPIISGYLTTAFSEFIGYKIVFGLVALIALAALFTTTRLQKIETCKKKVRFIDVFKTICKNKDGRRIMIVNLLDNFRCFTIGFYLVILVYRFVSDEMTVSLIAGAGSVLVIVGAIVYGVVISKDNRVKSILIGTVLTLAACCVMWFDFNLLTLCIFYFVYSFFNIFINMPVINTYFNVIEQKMGMTDEAAEVHTVREFFIAVGRVIGILMILLTPQNDFGSVMLLVIFVASSLVSAVLIKSINKDAAKENKE